MSPYPSSEDWWAWAQSADPAQGGLCQPTVHAPTCPRVVPAPHAPLRYCLVGLQTCCEPGGLPGDCLKNGRVATKSAMQGFPRLVKKMCNRLDSRGYDPAMAQAEEA